MPTYVAFLRAINLGAKRRFPKDAIKECVEGCGFTDVETHINTGNVRFTSRLRSRAKIEKALEVAFEQDRGFEVPTIVFTPAELRAIAEEAAGFGHTGRHYVELLRTAPSAAVIAAIEEETDAKKVAKVGGRALHLMVDSDYGDAARLRATVEKQLGVSTNRNAKVIGEIVEKWCR